MTDIKQIAVFGGGCFWCTEAIFENLRGVVSITPGYCGGKTEDPTYEDVTAGFTGHAEAVKIEFDPEAISYSDLLAVFFATHDPTSLDRQGNDIGTQYRSAIFYLNDRQGQEAEKFIGYLEKESLFNRPIVTRLFPFEKFFEAEDYHRQYYRNNVGNPYCQAVISPKLKKLREKFAPLLKPNF